jgi:hypothetical protein
MSRRHQRRDPLGLMPIATGVDDETRRRTLLSLGCGQGSGDFYRDAAI